MEAICRYAICHLNWMIVGYMGKFFKLQWKHEVVIFIHEEKLSGITVHHEIFSEFDWLIDQVTVVMFIWRKSRDE